MEFGWTHTGIWHSRRMIHSALSTALSTGRPAALSAVLNAGFRAALNTGHRAALSAALRAGFRTALTLGLLIPTIRADTAPAPLWQPPIGTHLSITAPYELPHGRYQAGHRGIDLSAAPPQQVRAPVSGVISFSGTVVDRPLVSIRVNDDTVVSLEPLQSTLIAGTQVSRGDPIGIVATGGHCWQQCLHLGVRINDEYVNPLQFFRGRPVLVPWNP